MTKSKKTPDFLIVRHGSNAANQGMCDRLPVAIVSAPTGKEACEKAAERINCYANQHLEWVAEKDVDADEWNAVLENDAIARENGEEGAVW